MHFAVMLFTSTEPDDALIYQAIERYAVDYEVEPWVEETFSSDEVTSLRAQEPELSGKYPDDLEFMKSYCDDNYGCTKVTHDEDGTYSMWTDRNEFYEFDWHQVGGRFSEFLPGDSDSSCLADLDFGAEVLRQSEEWGGIFRKYRELAAGLGPFACTTLEELNDSRAEFRDDPHVKAAADAVGTYFVENAILFALCSSATEQEFLGKIPLEQSPYAWIDLAGQYNLAEGDEGHAEYLQYRDSLPDSTWMTILDFHN